MNAVAVIHADSDSIHLGFTAASFFNGVACDGAAYSTQTGGNIVTATTTHLVAYNTADNRAQYGPATGGAFAFVHHINVSDHAIIVCTIVDMVNT